MSKRPTIGFHDWVEDRPARPKLPAMPLSPSLHRRLETVFKTKNPEIISTRLEDHMDSLVARIGEEYRRAENLTLWVWGLSGALFVSVVVNICQAMTH